MPKVTGLSTVLLVSSAFGIVGSAAPVGAVVFADAYNETPISAAGSVETDKQKKARLKSERKQQKMAEKAERKRLADLKRQYGAGPYPDEINAYLADKPEALKPLYRALFAGGERNSVLNFQRLGLAAMDFGEWQHAEKAFDGALVRIEAIYSKDKLAERSRALFHNDANKDFKGESYERSMAYYYRGLLYLRVADYDNARASFRMAEYQDTVSEAEEYQADFAVMNYLIGWTYHCQNSPSSAKEAFDIAISTNPALVSPKDIDRILLVAELGRGPVKARDGKQSEKLVFNKGPNLLEPKAQFNLGGAAFDAVPASSVFYQATTRGGRAIDGILGGKANFKEVTSSLSDASMISSVLGGGGMDAAGIGLVFSLFSSAAKTEADIRGWDNLPETIAVALAGPPEPGAISSARVSFLLTDQSVGEEVSPMMTGMDKECGIVWTRSQSSDGISPDVPGEDAGVAKALSRKKSNQQRDAQFRNGLIGA